MIDPAPYRAYNEQRQAAHQFRRLITCDTKTPINFAGNDYLGLSQHPALIARAQAAATDGTGATASRLITGNHPLYDTIEAKLAHGKGTESALVLASGYQANLTILAALADSTIIGKPVTILADRLIHNSLLQGGLLATATSDTRLTRFHHNDYAHLQSLLKKQTGRQPIIVTESVFGMDGDRADLDALATLSERHGALLYVDEAHATGLYGPNGFGLCAAHKNRIDIAMGTFGKALGSFGAYIACNATLRDYLIQRCAGLIYSTALPPSILASIDAALDLLPQLENERAHLAAQSARLRQALQHQGWNCGNSTTHIIPIILGTETAATTLAQTLRQNNILAPAIRPPTVPHGTSRLRLSLSAAHTAQNIDHLIATMAILALPLDGAGLGGGDLSTIPLPTRFDQPPP